MLRRPCWTFRGLAILGMGALVLVEGCRVREPEPDSATALAVLVPALPDSLDPFQDSTGTDELISFNAFEPLLRLAPSGALEPVLAQSWDASRQGELTLRLKPGVRFHDGTPLDAAAVVASLNAARKPGSPFAARLGDLTELSAADPGTVILRAPASGFFSPQSLADVPIVKLAPGGIPGGTGPYRVTTFTANAAATLVATEGSVTRPTLQRITVRSFRRPDEVQERLLSPDPPLLLTPPREVLPLARGNANYRVVTQPASEVIALALDEARDPTPGIGLSKNPFRRPEVRHALRLALDLEALRKGVEGGSLVATQMLPPTSVEFDPALAAPAPALEEARALLRKAGLPKGFEVRLDLDEAHEPLGRALAAQLQAVGIQLKVNPLRADRFLDVMQEESSLSLYSWKPGADPAFGLALGMHSRTADGRLGAANWTGYSDAEVDRAIEKALRSADPGGRREAVQAALRRLSEDSAWIPLLVPMSTMVLPKGLTFPARADGRIGLAEAILKREPTPTPPPGRQHLAPNKSARETR